MFFLKLGEPIVPNLLRQHPSLCSQVSKHPCMLWMWFWIVWRIQHWKALRHTANVWWQSDQIQTTPLALCTTSIMTWELWPSGINKCWFMLQRSLSHVWTNAMKCETHSSGKKNVGSHPCFWLHSHCCTKFTSLNEVLTKLFTSKNVKIIWKWFSCYIDARQHRQPFFFVRCNQMHKLELE
jgi:hypothetical protein